MAERGKRQRLIEAAQEAFHAQGIKKTTIADLAKRSEVPLGNVYYYFKTKAALTEAVLEAHAKDIDAALLEADESGDDFARLIAFLRWATAGAERKARLGCPIAILVAELRQGGNDDELAEAATELQGRQLRWLEERLGALYCGEFAEAEERKAANAKAALVARSLFVRIQGAIAGCHQLGDPALLRHESEAIEAWLRARR